MITIVSIVLYGISVFIGCMMGLGAGKAEAGPADEKTANTSIALVVALLLFFGLATILQVSA